MPILAPRRTPPCLIWLQTSLYACIKATGPVDLPLEVPMISSLGRRWEKEKPVPPAILWIIAILDMVFKIDSMSSSTGSTKQAESDWPILPELTIVGVLGMNFWAAMSL